MQLRPASSAALDSSSVRAVPSPNPQPVEEKHKSEAKVVIESTGLDLSCNMPLLRELAAKGDVDAQTRLGINLYCEGNCTAENEQEGILLLSKAATRSGTPAGQCALGYCYLYGLNKTKNLKAGFRCLQIASNQNYPPAQLVLAWCYRYGEGTTKNHQNALCSYEIAAKQGSAKAQYILGLIYDFGGLLSITIDKKRLYNILKWLLNEDMLVHKEYLESVMSWESLV